MDVDQLQLETPELGGGTMLRPSWKCGAVAPLTALGLQQALGVCRGVSGTDPRCLMAAGGWGNVVSWQDQRWFVGQLDIALHCFSLSAMPDAVDSRLWSLSITPSVFPVPKGPSLPRGLCFGMSSAVRERAARSVVWNRNMESGFCCIFCEPESLHPVICDSLSTPASLTQRFNVPAGTCPFGGKETVSRN